MPKYQTPKLSRDEVLKLLEPLLKDLPEEKYPMVGFGIRGIYGSNQRGVWDDAIGFIERHPGGTFAIFPGNTDPTAPFKKGLGMLSSNQVLWFKRGLHRGRQAFRQAKPCLVDRDGIGKRLAAPVSCAFNFHDSISATDTTSSLGCQTVPKAVFPAVRELGYMLAKKYYKDETFPYLLVDGPTVKAPVDPKVVQAPKVADGGMPKVGLDLCLEFEGVVLKAYPDPVTKAEPITIGVGTTVYPDGRKVKMGDTCTREQAISWLKVECDKRVAEMLPLIKVKLNANQVGALGSFVYNLNVAKLKESTLLKLLNKGDYKGAAEQFLVWNKAGSPLKPVLGLTRRRQAERKLFLA